MIIDVINQQKAVSIVDSEVQLIVENVLQHEQIDCDEISIHFVDTPTISKLHQDFFNDPTTTDCISFPIDHPDDKAPYCFLGEIFVCPETALNYAKEHLTDPQEEITLYIVHGLLHLLGHDDIDPQEQIKMKEAEAFHMKRLKENCFLLRPSC